MSEIGQRVAQIKKFTDLRCEAMEIQGERIMVPLEGRSITAAYYKAEEAHAPILFMFHGGGFCFGNCCEEDLMYDEMRTRMKVNVVSIGYRKIELFPHALDDCRETVLYFIRNDCFDFDRNNIMLGGSSAGANLAIGVGTLAWRNSDFKVRKELLNYPFLDMTVPQSEKTADPNEDCSMYDFFYKAYAPKARRQDPLISPAKLERDDVDPETKYMIILADNDPLHREGEEFAEKLKSFGCDCEYSTARGMGHGYFEYGYKQPQSLGWIPPDIKGQLEDGSLRETCDESMQKFTEFVREDAL